MESEIATSVEQPATPPKIPPLPTAPPTIPTLPKEAPVIATLLHVLCCTVFIYGYCSAFGHHIINLPTSSDIFALSVREMSQLYVYTIIVPLVIFVAPRLPFRLGGSGQAATDGQPPLAKLDGWVWGCVAVAVVAAIIFALRNQFPRALTQSPIELGSFVLLIGLLLIEYWLVFVRFRRKSFDRNGIAILGVIIITFCMVFGANKGLRDKFRDYQGSKDNYLTCIDENGQNLGIVIRNFGGKDLILKHEKETGAEKVPVAEESVYIIGEDRCYMYLNHADVAKNYSDIVLKKAAR